jgi:hypothetical protein
MTFSITTNKKDTQYNDLLPQTNLDLLLFILKILFTFLRKATLMRRSIVRSLPYQLGFPGKAFTKCPTIGIHYQHRDLYVLGREH